MASGIPLNITSGIKLGDDRSCYIFVRKGCGILKCRLPIIYISYLHSSLYFTHCIYFQVPGRVRQTLLLKHLVMGMCFVQQSPESLPEGFLCLVKLEHVHGQSFLLDDFSWKHLREKYSEFPHQTKVHIWEKHRWNICEGRHWKRGTSKLEN